MEYYNLLNLPFDATSDEIRAAYFEAARKYHPDAANGMANGNLFISIQNAYDVLSNDKRRHAYDQTIPSQAKEKFPLEVETSYSRKTIFQTSDPQLLYVILSIGSAQKVKPAERMPAHVCLIIDRSISMRGTRMEMVIKNLKQLIQWLQPDDVISAVAFSDRAEIILDPVECRHASLIDAKLYELRTAGATEIYQGLELGYDLFKGFAGKSSLSKHLLLVTDGHTYGDEEKCVQLAESAASEGVIFNAIGIGDEWNDTFLDRLSSVSGGSTHFIKNELDLRRFVESKTRSLGEVFARKAEIHLDLPEYVELKYAFRIQPDVAPLHLQLPIQIGTVEYNRKTSVIFEFNIVNASKAQTPGKIGDGKILLEIPGKRIPVERSFIHLELPSSSRWINEPVPTEVMQAMSKISLYRLQEKAREKAMSGDIDGATRHLNFLATRLFSQGENKLAGMALSEAEHLQKYGNFSKDGDKIIKYGTRSLFLLPGPEVADND